MSEPEQMFTITHEWLHQHKSADGGWSRRQLVAIGVEWPPKHGWQIGVIGAQISDTSRAVFERPISPVEPTPEPPSEELQAERNLRASCLDMAEAEVERLKAEHAAQVATLRAADAAQIATLITERDLLKRGVATVIFGDADAVIAKLVTERDAAQQEAQTLREALEEVYDAFRSTRLDASYTYADGLASAALAPRPQDR